MRTVLTSGLVDARAPGHRARTARLADAGDRERSAGLARRDGRVGADRAVRVAPQPSSLNEASRASNSSSRPASVSPIPSRSLSASLAWSRPMIPGTTPRTPATEQPGASSGGGGVG